MARGNRPSNQPDTAGMETNSVPAAGSVMVEIGPAERPTALVSLDTYLLASDDAFGDEPARFVFACICGTRHVLGNGAAIAAAVLAERTPAFSAACVGEPS